MGRVLQERIAASHYVVPLLYSATNIGDAAGDAVTLQANSLDYVMPAKGSIVGISARLNGALTTGTLTFVVEIDGTATTFTLGALSASAQQDYEWNPNGPNFAAGARIAVSWTKTGTVDPITLDAAIVVFVLLDTELS